jgi:hypothetical protein
MPQPMPTQNLYLLPCPCGHKVSIEPRQAGQTVRCTCGRPLTAPTMLGMASLERSEPTTAARRPAAAWGVPHRLILLGIVILVATALAAIGVYQGRPIPPADFFTFERNQRRAEEMAPSQTVMLWRYFQRGLEPGMTGQELQYDRALVYYRSWLGVATAFGLVGAGLVCLGIWKGRAGRG